MAAIVLVMSAREGAPVLDRDLGQEGGDGARSGRAPVVLEAVMADDEVEADRVEDEGEPRGSYLEWTATLIRILAVWMYAMTAVNASTIVEILSEDISGAIPGTQRPPLHSLVILPLSMLVVATILWRTSRRLAVVIWRGRTPDDVSPSVEPQVIQRSIVRGVGFYVAAHAVAGLPPAVANYLGRHGNALMAQGSWAPLLGVVLQLVMGLWLFLGTATLARWVEKARS